MLERKELVEQSLVLKFGTAEFQSGQLCTMWQVRRSVRAVARQYGQQPWRQVRHRMRVDWSRCEMASLSVPSCSSWTHS